MPLRCPTGISFSQLSHGEFLGELCQTRRFLKRLLGIPCGVEAG